MKPLSLIEYKIDKKTGCWIWQRATNFNYKTNRGGYGVKGVKGKLVYAHRFYYEKFKKKISKGLWVLHKCDNKRCVNPKHLFLGTNSDNIKDAIKKGMMNFPRPKGEDSGMAKLTEKKVLKIRKLYPKFSQRKLAKMFNVCRGTICFILKRKTWAFL